MLHSKNRTASNADWLLGSNAKGAVEVSSRGWGASVNRRTLVPVSVRGGLEGDVDRWSLGRRPRVRREARQFHRDRGKAVFQDTVTGGVKKSKIWDGGHHADL